MNNLNLSETQLEDIFNAQREFNTFVIKEDNYAEVNSWDAVLTKKWVSRQKTALFVELTELLDSTNWKWWMKESTENLQNLQVEIVDILHFLVSIYQIEFKDMALPIFNIHSTSSISTNYDILDGYNLYLKMLSSRNFNEITECFIEYCKRYNLLGEDLYKKYFAKMEVNLERQRQKNGYSKETKDAKDCEHI